MRHQMILESALPTDPQTLRELVVQLLSALQDKDRRIGQLSSQLEALRRRLFGRQSEKLDPDQLALDLGAWLTAQMLQPSEKAPAEPSDDQPKDERKGGHGRRRLPKELTRQRTEYHPAPAELSCSGCSGALKKIGEEVSEQLEYVPASLFVIEHARIKYACPHCQDKVVIGSLPIKPIDKGLPGPGLLAHVVTSKYADHLPLNRLEGIFQRQGVELSRSTLGGWVAASASMLSPIVAAMKTDLLASRKIHSDDTSVPVLDPEQGKTKTGRLWVYVGDDQHAHVVFDYSPDRKGKHPQEFLRGFEGFLQADAYSAYDWLYANQKILEVACFAHARRKFFDAMSSDSRRASIALAYIRRLYGIEKRARGLVAEKRYALRQEEAPPILEQFKAWLDQEALLVLPKSPLAEAIGYALNHWVALKRYLDDGILELDNNIAERALRRIAVGRKNWMFAGSDEGGKRAAILYSLVASCAALKIDPYAYLRNVIETAPTCSTPEDFARLTPKAWKASLDQSAEEAA
jgi:transposase